MSDYDHLYRAADKQIIFHEEEGDDLKPLVIPVPDSPPLNKIEGYGLHPKNQKYVRPKCPPRLKELNDRRYEDVEDYWRELEKNYDYYKDELYFINESWDRRLNGFWVFIFGQPYFVCPYHAFYLEGYTVGRTAYVFPDYRDRDRRWYHGVWHLDLQDADCGGINYAKHRREGATSRTSAINLNLVTCPDWKMIEYQAFENGIQSKNETSARDDVYLATILPQYNNLWFWFIPRNPGNKNPQAELTFSPPTGKIKKKKNEDDAGERVLKYLNTKCTYRDMSVSAYDGAKLRLHHGDESGKTSKTDVLERHKTVKYCITDAGGTNFSGFIINTSTVGDMVKEGGEKFKELCKQSKHHERNENNQTASGLYNMFMPAYDGLNRDFIDPYGMSIIDEPLPHQLEYMEGRYLKKHGNMDGFKPLGARKFLQNTRDHLLKIGDLEGYAKEKRQNPVRFRECFSMAIDEKCPFNITILENRLEQFAFGPNRFVLYGNYKYRDWDNSTWDTSKLPTLQQYIEGKTRVYFEQVPYSERKTAKFEVSYLFPDDRDSNKWVYNPQTRMHEPGNKNKFCAGGDPFKIKGKTKSGRASWGGGAVFRIFDSTVDSPEVDPMAINPVTGDFMHVTDRFCLTYLQRPESLMIYGEDMLKMCLYYGCTMFPEITLPFLWDYFEDIRHFKGWLEYPYDKIKGRESTQPGLPAHTKHIGELYSEFNEWINRSAKREVHMTILEQARDVGYDMEDYDLFAAGGWGLVSAKKSKLYTPAPSKIILGSKNPLDRYNVYRGN